MKSANLPEGIRRQRLDEASTHLMLAKTARHYYRQQCQEAEKILYAHVERKEPIRKMHYSFDLRNKFTFPLIVNKQAQHILKQLESVGSLALYVKGSQSKSII